MKLSAEEIRTLKAQAMMVEKGGDRFSVRLSVTGGYVTAAQLRDIQGFADQFATGSVHLTTRQGVEIPHVPYENLGPLRRAVEEAGLRLAAAGRCVRGITACPGSSCPRGLIDTQGIAQRLGARFGLRDGLPHKFKITISGCPNGCTKPLENDLGIMGRGKMYAIFVGGKMGKTPRAADLLPIEVKDEERLFEVVEEVIDWYAAHGEDGERFGATIDRLGLDSLLQAVAPANGSAANLMSNPG